MKDDISLSSKYIVNFGNSFKYIGESKLLNILININIFLNGITLRALIQQI